MKCTSEMSLLCLIINGLKGTESPHQRQVNHTYLAISFKFVKENFILLHLFSFSVFSTFQM